MNRKTFGRIGKWVGLMGLLVALVMAVNTAVTSKPLHALPEYAARTGEPCAACHVNPGGGGPRTLRGLLWAARGRPDQVPQLGNILAAPGVTDGAELYDIACAGCHGLQGEGLFGTAIAGTGLRQSKIQSTILRGRERSGMPPFEGQFTDAQLEALVAFTAGIASGELEPPPMSYPLPPAQFGCEPAPGAAACGGGN
ncbi:MAG: c-type cytochrome [Anaerolineae bacterium]